MSVAANDAAAGAGDGRAMFEDAGVAAESVRRAVNIIGEDCDVSVHQSSKTVWVASGSIEGQYLSVKSRSANSALNDWIAAATYRRARN